MQQPTPATPNINSESIDIDRNNNPYAKLLEQPTQPVNNYIPNANYPIQNANIFQPQYIQVVPQQIIAYESTIHKQSNLDRRTFTLKITGIWIAQLSLQLNILSFMFQYSEFAMLFYNHHRYKMTPFFYFTIVGFMMLVAASHLIIKHRKPLITYTLLILTAIFTGLFQAGLVSPLYFNQHHNSREEFWVWLGGFWIAITVLGLFSLVSITIYLRKEKNEVNPSTAYKYMYIVPMIISTLALLGTLNIFVFIICILVFGVGGSIYGYYYLSLIVRMTNQGKHKFDRIEYIQAGLILNRNMLIPCLA